MRWPWRRRRPDPELERLAAEWEEVVASAPSPDEVHAEFDRVEEAAEEAMAQVRRVRREKLGELDA